MPEFIFMLTHEDVTVENAFEVHGEIRDVGLRYVGFKDIGLPFDRLKALTEVIHECGQEVMLEVVSEGKRDELRSAGRPSTSASTTCSVAPTLRRSPKYSPGVASATALSRAGSSATRASSVAASRRSRRAPDGWRPWRA